MNAAATPELRICFVCWGNICRSPAAEFIMRDKLERAGLGERVAVESRGTSDEHLGQQADRRTIAEGKRRGIDIVPHRVSQFTTSDFDRFDLIFIADGVNHSRVLRRARTDDDTRRVQLMQRSGDDVPDPWYGGTQDFVEAFDLIDLACDDILVEVQAQLNRQ
jgi:protein-tyrosine phosphatase